MADERKAKRIVIIGSAYPYRGGGISSFNERLAEAFQARGHKVIILTFTFQYPRFLFPGTTQITKRPKPEGLEIIRSIHTLSPFNWIRAARILYRLQPDIVFVRYWTPFLAPALGSVLRRFRKKNKQARIIALTDNIIPHEARFWDRLLTRYFLNSVTAAITLSQKVCQEIAALQHSLKRVITLAHPLYDHGGPLRTRQEARVYLKVPQEAPVLLFFGFIRKYKGLALALEALALLKKQCPEVRLLVAGEFYEDPKFYKDLVKKLDIAEQLIWRTHFIANEDIGYYFSACDAVLQPYLSASQSGITPLSLYYERPVLATRVGGLAEQVAEGATGLLCAAAPQDMAKQMRLLLEKNRQNVFTPHLKEKKKQYDWAYFCGAVEDLDEDLCQNHSPL